MQSCSWAQVVRATFTVFSPHFPSVADADLGFNYVPAYDF